jgi:hypothetical protein
LACMWPPKRTLQRSCRHVISGSVSAFVAATLAHADDRDQRARVDRLAMATHEQPKQRCFGSTHTNHQGWEESSVPTLEASSAQVERP